MQSGVDTKEGLHNMHDHSLERTVSFLCYAWVRDRANSYRPKRCSYRSIRLREQSRRSGPCPFWQLFGDKYILERSNAVTYLKFYSKNIWPGNIKHSDHFSHCARKATRKEISGLIYTRLIWSLNQHLIQLSKCKCQQVFYAQHKWNKQKTNDNFRTLAFWIIPEQEVGRSAGGPPETKLTVHLCFRS